MEENIKLKSNKERLTEQLEKRHKERQLNLDNLQELKTRESVESEAIDYFQNIFETKIDEIENDLTSLTAAETEKSGIAVTFNKINNAIYELQKYLTNSTIFLTDYKIKRGQNKINELTCRSDELKKVLIPKKKFGFRNKTDIAHNNTKNDNKLKEKELANENLQRQQQLNIQTQQQFEWTLANETNKIFALDELEINARDITLSNLTNCVIKLHGHLGSLQASQLTNCLILCGPVARSFFADNCVNCKFVFACQQMRLHSSKSCDIYIHVTCRAIIEDCHDLLMGPYNYGYPNLDVDFVKSGLDREKNNWQDVGDFNWLSPDKPSPNWKKMSEKNLIVDWDQYFQDFTNEIMARS